MIRNVNSTAKGGGVAETLRPLLGYCRGAGVDTRWVVVSGGPGFFEITKRLHNRLHGFARDGGQLGLCEQQIHERTMAANAAELAPLIEPQDVVILHDPQTAGLAASVHATAATVIWRCHVGLDHAIRSARGGCWCGSATVRSLESRSYLSNKALLENVRLPGEPSTAS